MLNRPAATSVIDRVFALFLMSTSTHHPDLDSMSNGKLYELYVLSELIDEIANRGFQIEFMGSTLMFKSAPGKIKTSDPHFRIISPNGVPLWIFVDIEFCTLGSSKMPVTDLSGTHELDIVVVMATPDYPQNDEIVMAVECKSGVFRKRLLKEVLGVRRELSYFDRAQPSLLTCLGGNPVLVAASPPSEFWFAYLDPAGDQYSNSPAAFGITFKNIEP